MKQLLILFCCFTAIDCFGQDQPDLQKLGRPFKLEKKKFTPLDSALSQKNGHHIPNPLLGKFEKGKLIGNNGNGQNIYVLPVDNMPCIRPDSTYQSKMPVAGGLSKLP